jgi:hypothetical protein
MCSVPQLHVLQALCTVSKGTLTADELHAALPLTHRPETSKVTQRLMRSCAFLQEYRSGEEGLFRTVMQGASGAPFAVHDAVLAADGSAFAFRRAAGPRKRAAAGKGDVARCEAAVVRFLKKSGATDFSILCDAIRSTPALPGVECDNGIIKAAVDSLLGKEIVELRSDGSFAYKP